MHTKGEFTLANFARNFALSLHVLQKKIFFHYLMCKPSAKSPAKLCQCKCTLSFYVTELITAVMSFMIQAPELIRLKLKLSKIRLRGGKMKLLKFIFMKPPKKLIGFASIEIIVYT